MISTAIVFLTCSPAAATHFANLGQKLALNPQYKVSFVAAGAGLGKLKDYKVEAIDFNPEKLDLSNEAVQIKLAQEVGKICSSAKIIILDVGHLFFKVLQEQINLKEVHVVTYYENSENYVPGGYSKTAFEVIKLSRFLLLANFNFAQEEIYRDEGVVNSLT